MSTEIQWTDETWNPVTGCSKVSPGCAHCYAERVAIRLWPSQYPKVAVEVPIGDCTVPGDANITYRDRQFTDVRCHEDRLDQPLRWKKPRKVFVNSMSDLFHEDVPDDFIMVVFAVMARAPEHTFQVLTKRAERLAKFMERARRGDFFGDSWARRVRRNPHVRAVLDQPRATQDWPLKNVWLGVSVENQRFADERIPLLLQTPAAVRFISAEPLLGPVDLSAGLICDACRHPWRFHTSGGMCQGTREGIECYCVMPREASLDWVIVGGESGGGARPFDVAWARSIVQQCQAAGVPVFVKQLGSEPRDRNDAGFEGDTPTSWPMDTDIDEDLDGFRDGYQGAPVRPKLRDRKGGDISEWPSDLQVREFPDAAPPVR